MRWLEGFTRFQLFTPLLYSLFSFLMEAKACSSISPPNPVWQSVWRLCVVVVWWWSSTGCCRLAVWTTPGWICHLLGTFIQSAFSLPLVLFPREWVGLELLSFAVHVQHSAHWSTLCHLEILNWDCTAGATVSWLQLVQDVNPEDPSLLRGKRRTCCKEVQHGLVRMRDSKKNSYFLDTCCFCIVHLLKKEPFCRA